MNAINILLTAIASLAIRMFPLAVAFCVLYFPYFKGVMPGYVPVVVGAVIAGMILWKRSAIENRLERCSKSNLQLMLYVFPAVIQLVLIFIFRPMPMFDGLFVLQHAQHLVATGSMDPMTYYPPAQTWWYAAWFKLFDDTAIIAQVSQIPLSLGVIWCTLRVAREGLKEPAARLAALTVAWYPSFIGYVLTTPYYHYLYTLLVLLMVWGALRFSRGDFRMSNAPWMFLTGIAVGLGALTKGTQLIAPLQVAVWMLLVCCAKRIFPFKRMLAGGAIMLAGFATVLAPWVARNWVVFDDIVPVCTSGGLVLYSANNPESNGLYSEVPDLADIKTPREMLAHADACTARAKTYIRENPRAFVRMAGFKFLHTWGVEATFVDLINYRGEVPRRMDDAFSLIFLTGWAALVFMWMPQALKRLARREALTSSELLIGVIILSNALVYVVFEGGDRHHLPMVPLIVVSLYSVMHNRSKTAEEPSEYRT